MKARNYWFLVVIVFLLLSVASYSCWITFKDLNAATLSRRRSLASLATITLKDKLDRAVDLGVSLSTRPELAQYVQSEDWDQAIKYLENVPKKFSYVDNIVLFDVGGTIKQIAPPAPDVVGKNFAYRDYYQGVTKDWQPYISEVFTRAAEPKYNVVVVAVPIRSTVTDNPIGILVMTIKLDTIIGWSKEINFGNSGFIYIVDANNHLVAHPNLTNDGAIVDYTAVPVVHKLRTGETGVEVLFNPIDKESRVTAYDLVPGWNWGVVVVERADEAFADRNRQTLFLAFIWLCVILIITLMFYRALLDHQNLRNQHNREHLLLDSIGDGVFAIDRFWNIVLWNKSAARLTGFAASDVLGRPFREVLKFVNVTTRKENIVFIEEAMLYGEIKSMANHTVVLTKDGRELPIGDSCAPIFDDRGVVSGAIIVFRDMSLQEELEKKEKELVRVKDEFLFRTVHDLRAPANIIRLALSDYFEPVEIAQSSEKLKQGIEFIKEANNRMAHLIEELLSVGRGESLDKLIKKESLDLPALINDLLILSKPALEKKSIVLNHVMMDSAPKVLSDASVLKEVFSNLIDNAIKYNKNGGELTITYEPQGKFMLTYIQDTGVGIASDLMNKLFDPYFRAYSGSDIQGTGLGLYIVKNLVEKMGGKIAVSSTLNQGTKFTVYLPLA